MVVIDVYKKFIYHRYKSTLLSKATFFVFISNLITIILPFIFAYRSRGLWLKHDTFYEQPDVHFKGEFLLVGITNNLSNPIVCTTFAYYHQETKSLDTCSIVKAREIDNNHDGKPDELYFNINIVLPKDIKITFLNLFIPLDYKLHTVCPLQMQSAILYQQFLNDLTYELHVKGDLQIVQVTPLHCYKKGKDAHYDYPVIQKQTDIRSYSIENIITEYWKRNVTTQLTNIYTYSQVGGQSQLTFNLHIRYIENYIYYKPEFWQIMKCAWIQYLSLYIIFAYVTKKIKNYIFENHLVLFYKDKAK